jgi:phage protein D
VSVEAVDHVALSSVLLDGAPVSDEVQDCITEIRVLNYMALPDMCTFDLFFGIEDFENQPFEIGKKVEIKLGDALGRTTTSLFKGEIVTLEPVFEAGGVALRVRGLDRAHRLQRARNIRTFAHVSIADAASRVITEAGLRAAIGPGLDLRLEHIQQDNETDLEFLWRLARRFGAEVFVDDETVRIERPEASSPIPLEWPRDVSVFRPRVTAVQQVGAVSVTAFNGAEGEVISATQGQPAQVSENGIARRDAAGAFGNDTLHISSAMLESREEADALAQAMLDHLANGYIAAEGECPGNPRIRAGVAINVTGVGSEFSGVYRVQSSTHVVSGGGAYVTEFTNSPVQTIRGALGGSVDQIARQFGAHLTVGIVTNNKDEGRDGRDLARVKVSYPHYNPVDEGAWAQVAFANAGPDRGQVMMPQVGDEVLIAFLHADTRFPVVLGSLYNGKAKPGGELVAKSEGSYVLRSDMRIDMKATKEILVAGGETGTIEVQKDLALESKTAGLTLTSQSDMGLTSKAGLTEKAMQNVTITSDAGNLTVQAKAGSVTLKGLTVEVSADTQLKLSGAIVQVSGQQIMLG